MKITQHSITLRQPDDWHLHLRDGDVLKAVITPSATVFRRAVVMPNLQPPITTVEQANIYKKNILKAIPKGISFTPLMTAYLTDQLSPIDLEDGFHKGAFFAAKLYPANSTTNSSDGITDLSAINPILESMERIGMPLLIHGEVTDPEIDIFDRECFFIEKKLQPLLKLFPNLRIVLEHITTKEAVQFVESSNNLLAATITPHHLHINRNAMFFRGLNSDFYCLPVAKREHHRLALRRAATSGKACFFLGTDSAPHTRMFKESSCGCAGIFNAPYALESYAEVFEQEGCIEKLEPFASEFGAAFYGLPLNESSITLVKRSQIVPDYFEVKGPTNSPQRIVPFHAGEKLQWTISRELS